MKYTRIKLAAFTLAVTVILIMALTACGSEHSMQTNAPATSGISDSDLPASVTDIYGRTVSLPQEINSTICLGASALRMVCYLQAEDKVVGVEVAEHTQTLTKPYNYLNYEQFQTLPIIGQGGNNNDIPYEEEIITVNPDVIIASYTQDAADDLQAKTGIPVICVASDVLFDPTMYQYLEMIGTVLVKKTAAQKLLHLYKAFKKI